MQYHSTKYNEYKNGDGYAPHVKKMGIKYHSKMYHAHKAAMKNGG